MDFSSIPRLDDNELRAELRSETRAVRVHTARLVALIAGYDWRRLYAPDGYPSTLEYCIGELGMAEESALKRIRAARAVQDFPIMLGALEDGRLHLTGLVVLAPQLRAENVDELLAAAAHRTVARIKVLLAERFPRSESLALVTAVAEPGATSEVDSNPPGMTSMEQLAATPPAPPPAPRRSRLSGMPSR